MYIYTHMSTPISISINRDYILNPSLGDEIWRGIGGAVSSFFRHHEHARANAPTRCIGEWDRKKGNNMYLCMYVYIYIYIRYMCMYVCICIYIYI